MQPFNYDECRDILHRALIESLDAAADRIRSLVAAERSPQKWEDVCGIDGVSYDILPWHCMVALSFRIYADEPDESRFPYSAADWKYYEFMGNENTLDAAREYTHRVHAAAGDAYLQHELMHLIYLAAAAALLDGGVAQRFRSFGINAPVIGDQLPSGRFEYMVLDEDRVFKANYCEIVLGNRLSKRLLGRPV